MNIITLGILAPPQITDDGYFTTYTEVVKEFTGRILGQPDDVLKAIMGVLRTLGPSRYAFDEGTGMPSFGSNLAKALLWQPLPDKTMKERKVAVPSWSWAHWEFQDGCHWELDGVDESFNPSMVFERIDGIVPGTGFKSRRTQTENSLREGRSKIMISSKQFEDSPTMIRLNATISQFHVGAALGTNQADGPDVVNLYELVDRRRRCTGEIWIRNRVAAESAKYCECIGLSHGKSLSEATHPADIYTPTTTEYDHQLVYGGYDPVSRVDGSRYAYNPPRLVPIQKKVVLPKESWPVVYVMLVTWTEDVAFRVGIGKVTEEAWNMADSRQQLACIG